MNSPWASIFLSSVAGTFAIVRFAPQYSILSSYAATFLVFLIVGVLGYIVYSAIIYPRYLSPLRHLPHAPGGSLINGHFSRIMNEPAGTPHKEWIAQMPNEGLIVYGGFLNEERILIVSPQALGEVLTTNSYEYIKPALVRNGLGRVLGTGLILAEGDEHKAQRKSLMPAFAFRHIKDLYPVFWKKSCELVDALMATLDAQSKEASEDGSSDPSVVEIGGWSSRAALDIIGTAGLGKDFGAIKDPNTKLNATYRKVFSPSQSGKMLGLLSFVFPQWFVRALPAAHNNNIMEASHTIKEVARGLIRHKQEQLNVDKKRTDVDILSVALESGGFSEDNLVNQMMTFLAAGHETTATTMTWAVYQLCRYPAMQDRLRQEVRANLPSIDSDSTINAEMLDKCHYLHAVCNEILRLNAPVPLTMRETRSPQHILGHYVPKGTHIVLSAWGVNTAVSQWGPDASEFNPDRWMGTGKAKSGGADSNYSLLTFLHGPRSCIGQSFAKAEFASLLAALVGRFEMELQDKEKEIVIQGGITSKPKGGMPVKLKALDGW